MGLEGEAGEMEHREGARAEAGAESGELRS
jgi:hypothetical protein